LNENIKKARPKKKDRTMLREVTTNAAPKAIGPYSQAIYTDKLLFVSGQLPIDPATGNVAGDNIKTQTFQSLSNLGAILTAAGMNFENLAIVKVYLANMDDFISMNEVYASFFETRFPARAAIEVSRLPKDALIEIEAIGFKE
jgi:2-iminobutanoate/2-iminopropanoate deaminase